VLAYVYQSAVDHAQLEKRRSGVTATDIPKLFGMHGSPWKVYAEKRGLIAPEEATEQMWWASRLQEKIAEGYAELYHRKIEWLDRTFEKDGEPLFLATPDFRHTDGLCEGGEVKTSLWGEREWWGAEDTDEVPPRVILQVQWQMLVMGWATVIVPAFFGGARLTKYRVDADPELQGELAEQARRFWKDHIEAGVPPPLDGSLDAKRYLRRRYPNATEELREATAGEVEICRQFVEAREEAKKADAKEEKLRQMLTERIGFAKGISADGYTARLSDVKGSTYTVTRESYRALRVNGPPMTGPEPR